MIPITLTSNPPGRGPTVYVCQNCHLVHRQKVTAEACCLCDEPMCVQIRSRTWRVYCDIHQAEHDAERSRLERERYEALPLGEPTEVLWINDHFYFDENEARDVAFAIGGSHYECHPCVRGKAEVPFLYDVVAERIWEQYDSDEAIELAPEIVEALAAAQKVLEEHAPTIWTPDTSVRIDLPRATP